MSIEKINNQSVNTGMVVDDGSVKEQIRNKFGEVIGEFTFRPGDIGIYKRYNEVVSKFDTMTEPLEHMDIEPDGTTTDEASIAALNESEKRLCELVDYIFDADAAEAFFGKMYPFSIVGGRFYCERALSALGNYISQHSDREVKKFNKNTERYTHGYRTGKHKDGGKAKK